MITQAHADQLAASWLHAWNKHDIKRIMAHYADGIEFSSPFVKVLLNQSDGKINGKPALESYFLRGLAKYPALKFQLLHVLPGMASFVLIYNSVNNLLAAEMMEIDADGLVSRVLAHYRDPESTGSGIDDSQTK